MIGTLKINNGPDKMDLITAFFKKKNIIFIIGVQEWHFKIKSIKTSNKTEEYKIICYYKGEFDKKRRKFKIIYNFNTRKGHVTEKNNT